MDTSIYKIILLVFICSLQNTYAQINLDSTYKVSDIRKMLKTAQENNDRRGLADAYYLLAEFESNSFDNAGNPIRNYNNAKEYYSLLKDSLMVSNIDVAIGRKYREAGYYSESIISFERALDYFEAKDDLYNVSYINYFMSQVYRDNVDPENELSYLNRAIKLNEELKDSILLIDILVHKIDSYTKLNEIDSAELVALDIARISSKKRDNVGMGKGLFYLGKLNYEKGNYTRAEKYLLESFSFIQHTPYDELRRDVYSEIVNLYETTKDFENAYVYSKKYSKLNDSILNQNRIESQNNFATYYALDEKKEDNEKLKIDNESALEKNQRQKTTNYLLSGGLFVLLALIYFIIRFFRQKISTDEIIYEQKKEIDGQRIRELEDNIKISSMQSMIEGQEIERERISKDLHDSLGGLLSTIKLQFDSVQSKETSVTNLKEYQSANKMLDTAVQEVRSISQNLQPGSLSKLGLVPALKDLFNRFDEEIYPEIDFQTYDVPIDLPNMISLSIYRVIQELLHNTIKHAKASEILIQINREGDEIVIQYEDDGIGYDEKKLKRRGMGLENITSRINYLKGTLQTDSAIGEGTSTMIHLKYK